MKKTRIPKEQKEYDKIRAGYLPEGEFHNSGSSGTNIYTCNDCTKNTSYTHVDRGVTPMFMRCPDPDCKGRTVSHMYTADPSKVIISFEMEWYRPLYKEAKKLNKKYPGMMHHFLGGGLTDRIKVKDEV